MTGMADTPLVTFERSGAIAEIRLNRPDKLNAISADMLDDLHRCLDQAEHVLTSYSIHYTKLYDQLLNLLNISSSGSAKTGNFNTG